MCEIMDELLKQEREEVWKEAQIEVDQANLVAKKIVEMLVELNFSSEEIIKRIMDKLQLNEVEARKYLV